MHLFDVYVKVNRDASSEKERGEAEVTDQKAREVFRKMESGALYPSVVFARLR